MKRSGWGAERTKLRGTYTTPPRADGGFLSLQGVERVLFEVGRVERGELLQRY